MCAPARSLQHLCFRCRRVRSIARCGDRLLDRDFLRQEPLRKCEAQAQRQARTKPPDGECPIRIWSPGQWWSNLSSGPFVRTRLQTTRVERCVCVEYVLLSSSTEPAAVSRVSREKGLKILGFQSSTKSRLPMATPIADGVVSIVDDNENVLGTKCVGRILVCRGVDCAGAPWGWNGFLQYGYMCIYLHIYVMYIYIYIYLYVYIYLYMCTYGYTHRECALDQMCGANSRLQEREQGRFTMCLY